jgi:hypothetical protein
LSTHLTRDEKQSKERKKEGLQ